MGLEQKSLLEFEQELWPNFEHVAGLDEAGRGCWAGPVAAAAVILPQDVSLPGVNDSKKLSEKQRDKAFDDVLANCVSFGIGLVDPKMIDQINILEATKRAMLLAVAHMKIPPDFLLIDGNMTLQTALPQRSLISGDSRSLSIAAASILAKVTRDRYMVKISSKYPDYGFEKHKGYGTPIHRKALKTLGFTPIHRLSYKPVAESFENAQTSNI